MRGIFGSVLVAAGPVAPGCQDLEDTRLHRTGHLDGAQGALSATGWTRFMTSVIAESSAAPENRVRQPEYAGAGRLE